MRRSIAGIMCLGMMTFAFAGCKKGENDPLLSVKSRKARVSGVWKLESGKVTETSVLGSSVSSLVTTYTDVKATEVNDAGGSSITTIYDLEVFEMIYERDGTFSSTIESTAVEVDGNAIDASSQLTTNTKTFGKWVFLGRNNSADLKNKEAILLSGREITETLTGAVNSSDKNTLSGWDDSDVMTIDRLKQKELIFKGSYSNVDVNGNSIAVEYEWVFIANN